MCPNSLVWKSPQACQVTCASIPFHSCSALKLHSWKPETTDYRLELQSQVTGKTKIYILGNQNISKPLCRFISAAISLMAKDKTNLIVDTSCDFADSQAKEISVVEAVAHYQLKFQVWLSSCSWFLLLVVQNRPACAAVREPKHILFHKWQSEKHLEKARKVAQLWRDKLLSCYKSHSVTRA